MATPFLYLLPRSALAAYPFILRGTRAWLSSRAIEQSIRAAGMQISRFRSILPLMRKLKEIERSSRTLKFLQADRIINVAKLQPAVTTIRKNYSFTVRAKIIIKGGHRIERFIQVGFDNPGFTKADVIAAADNALRDQEAYEVLQVDGLSIEEGLAANNPTITG